MDRTAAYAPADPYARCGLRQALAATGRLWDSVGYELHAAADHAGPRAA